MKYMVKYTVEAPGCSVDTRQEIDVEPEPSSSRISLEQVLRTFHKVHPGGQYSVLVVTSAYPCEDPS